MKRIIKESTVITETVVNNDGETFIIDRRHKFNSVTELINDKELINNELETWKELNKVYQEEIAKEIEKYKKQNSIT